MKCTVAHHTFDTGGHDMHMNSIQSKSKLLWSMLFKITILALNVSEQRLAMTQPTNGIQNQEEEVEEEEEKEEKDEKKKK